MESHKATNTNQAKKPKFNKQLSVRLTKAEKMLIVQLADKKDCSMSEIVRGLVNSINIQKNSL